MKLETGLMVTVCPVHFGMQSVVHLYSHEFFTEGRHTACGALAEGKRWREETIDFDLTARPVCAVCIAKVFR